MATAIRNPSTFTQELDTAGFVLKELASVPVKPPFRKGRLPSEEKVPFGQRIKDLREAKGWSQRDLAGEMRVSHVYVLKIEHGTDLPTIDQHVNLANAFGMTFSEFVSETWDGLLYSPRQ